MDLICCFQPKLPALDTRIQFAVYCLNSPTCLRFGFPATPFRRNAIFSFEIHAKKKKEKKLNIAEPTPSRVEDLLSEEENEEEVEQVSLDDFQNELLMDDDDDGEDDEDDDLFLEEEFDESEDELYAGDGGGGGGIKLAATWWDKEALSLAEAVCDTFDGDLGIYAFKTLPNSSIQVRIERLTNKSGSPNMEDIEAFSTTYRARLAEAELTKSIPDNISLEVSSPGVERVVRIPQDLDRYKDRPMYVKYTNEVAETEGEGIFRLVSFDVEAESCIWGIADIRVNREKAGKGRPLNKKQREWRLETSFQSLRLVRLHSEC